MYLGPESCVVTCLLTCCVILVGYCSSLRLKSLILNIKTGPRSGMAHRFYLLCQFQSKQCGHLQSYVEKDSDISSRIPGQEQYDQLKISAGGRSRKVARHNASQVVQW